MALDQKFFKSTSAGSGTDQEQGLVLHLDANDVDSYDGDGSTWFDITEHEVNIPLADKASNLVLNLDGGTYTSGAWEDQSANTNNASLNGNTTYNSDTKGYFTLDGVGDYLQISDHSSLNLAGGGATYEMWFRQHTLAASEHLFGRFESGNFDFFISTGSSGAISLHFYNGSSSVGNINSAGGKYTANTWHHVAVTLSSGSSGGTIKLYIDGNLEGSTTLSGNRIADPTADLFLGILGSGYTTQYEFTGDIGTTRIYNVALTASEVAQNFRAGNNLSYSSTYDTGLALHFDASDIDTTANTWTDKVSSIVLTKSGNSSYDAELGDYLELEGGYYGNDSAAVQIKDSNQDFTVEYFGQHVFGNQRAILGIMQSTLQGLLIAYTSSNYFLSYNYKSGTIQSSQGLEATVSSTGMTSNKWHHVVLVYDQSTNVKLYVDGILNATSTLGAGGTGWTTTDGIRIGSHEAFTNYYPSSAGQMGFLKIYQGKLSDAQVAQNYLATKNKYPNGINFTGSNISWNANGYFSFNGSNANFVTSGAPGAVINATGFTVSAWVWRTNGVTGTNTIITNCTAAGNTGQNYILSMSGSGTVHFHIYGTDNYAGVNNVVSYETWTHLAGVVEFDGVKRIYKNGVVQLSTSAGYSADTVSSYNTFIGSLGSYGNYHNGRIGAVKYYKKPLTADELLADFNATKGTYGL